MSYIIFYTEESEQDLIDVYRYIAKELMVPVIAENQIRKIMKAIDGLKELPFKLFLYIMRV